MRKLKLFTIVGTRPELIRLSRIIPRLDECFEHILIHTGQNYDYELSQIFFEDLGIREPDYFLDCGESTISACSAIGKIIARVDNLLEKIRPEAVLVLGDTNSCLSVIAAKKRKIPIFHIEAGNRCFDQRVPEETNRKIVDHIADINLTYSDIAREYLLSEGFPPDQIIKIGSPMNEVLSYNFAKIKRSNILNKLKLEKGQYFLVSCHREENVDSKENIEKLGSLLKELLNKFQLRIIVSTHPRTMKRIQENTSIFDNRVEFLKPFGYHDYISLQLNSKVVLSDSGTITEESSILNFNALNIRDCHERPEGMEETPVILTGLCLDRVMQALSIISNQRLGKERSIKLVADYNVDNVSEKVTRIICSYTDYINKKVWKRY